MREFDPKHIQPIEEVFTKAPLFNEALQPLIGCRNDTHIDFDGFVAKLNPMGSGSDDLLYCTYLKGSNYDYPRGIALDNAGSIWVTGETVSTDFPIINAIQATYGGGSNDVFITKINPAGSGANDLIYSTYFGGSERDHGYSIAIDDTNNVYVAGYTDTNNLTATAGAFQPTFGGIRDAFVAKLNPDGSLFYFTYLGGSGEDLIQSMALDGTSVVVTGPTASSNFPITEDAFQDAKYNASDAFVTKLNLTGSGPDDLIFSTYFGANGTDVSTSVALDDSGNFYITGYTSSTDLATAGAFQQVYGGGQWDAFISKITVEPPCIDGDGDTYFPVPDCGTEIDCQDDAGGAAINPGATEIPDNTVDENCDGVVLDILAPGIALVTPAGATAPADTSIVVLVSDGASGIVDTSVTMKVNGDDVTTGSLIFDGTPAEYSVTFMPPPGFLSDDVEVVVIVVAADNAGHSNTEEFRFRTTAGSGWPPDEDEDLDGIPNGVEENLLHSDPTMKTLFVRPKKRISLFGYEYWDDDPVNDVIGFISLFPWAGRPGFANIPPLTNAGIEVMVIGADDNPYYDAVLDIYPMREFNYDPKTDANQPPCDIMEVVYNRDDDDCEFSTEDSEGHTYFTGTKWTWSTKGYTNHATDAEHYREYRYFTAQVYPYPLANYFDEGAYNSIAVGKTPILLEPPPDPPCTYDQCWNFANTGHSPMNLDATDPVNGLPDGKVEFSVMTFSAAGGIQSMGATGLGYESPTVLKRTIAHEIGHALLFALDDEDHCEDFDCIMYHSAKDWELHNFGSPSGCTHSPNGSRDIRAVGAVRSDKVAGTVGVHNRVHNP